MNDLDKQRQEYQRQLTDLERQLANSQNQLRNANRNTQPMPNHPAPPPINNVDLNHTFNNTLLGAMDIVNQSMNQQYTVNQESLRQTQLASKEHYLSNTPVCDGSDPKKFES